VTVPVGFVGLGAMGTPMVEALLDGGYAVIVADVRPAAAAALAERGIATTLLGARTPPAAPTAAASLEGGLLVVFALLPQRVPEGVQDPPANADVVAAGPGWDPAALPPRVRYVNSLPETITLCTTDQRGATDEPP